MPTFLILREDLWFKIVSAVKKAAEDGSPGISTLNDFKNFFPKISIVLVLFFLFLTFIVW